MLAKRFRLPIQDFVGKRGKLLKTPYFLLKIYSAEFPHSRFGVTVSAKVAKKASERNKLKRLVYNFLKYYYKEIPLGDYWISVLPPAVSLSKKDFIGALTKLIYG